MKKKLSDRSLLAQAVIGQTLSNLSPGNVVKSGLLHPYNKLLGVTDKGVGESIISAYRTQLKQLKDDIYGRTEPEAPKSDDNSKKDDDSNPFQSPQDLDDESRSDVNSLYESIDDESRSDVNSLYESIDDENIYTEIEDSVSGKRGLNSEYEEVNDYLTATDVNEQFKRSVDVSGGNQLNSIETGPIAFDEGSDHNIFGTNIQDEIKDNKESSIQGFENSLSLQSDGGLNAMSADTQISEEEPIYSQVIKTTKDSEALVGQFDQEVIDTSADLLAQDSSGISWEQTEQVNENDYLTPSESQSAHVQETDSTASLTQGLDENIYEEIPAQTGDKVEAIETYSEEEEKQDIANANHQAFEVVEDTPPPLPPRPEHFQETEDDETPKDKQQKTPKAKDEGKGPSHDGLGYDSFSLQQEELRKQREQSMQGDSSSAGIDEKTKQNTKKKKSKFWE